jgi:hypothetical protein
VGCYNLPPLKNFVLEIKKFNSEKIRITLAHVGFQFPSEFAVWGLSPFNLDDRNSLVPKSFSITFNNPNWIWLIG